MPSPLPSARCRWHQMRSKNPGSDEKWTQDAASVSQPLLRKPLATGWRRGEGLSLTKQLITIAPVVGIPGGLYGRHTSTPFLIQARQLQGRRGRGQFQQVGLFCPHACRLWGILAKFCEFGNASSGWEGRVILTEWHSGCHNSGVSNIGRSHIIGHSDSWMIWTCISWRWTDNKSLANLTLWLLLPAAAH